MSTIQMKAEKFKNAILLASLWAGYDPNWLEGGLCKRLQCVCVSESLTIVGIQIYRSIAKPFQHSNLLFDAVFSADCSELRGQKILAMRHNETYRLLYLKSWTESQLAISLSEDCNRRTSIFGFRLQISTMKSSLIEKA